MWDLVFSFFFFFKDFIYLLSRERGRDGERERSTNVWLPLACPQLGTRPTTQAHAPTGNRTSDPLNQTSDPLVSRLALSPLSHSARVDLVFSFAALSTAVGAEVLREHGCTHRIGRV